MSWYFSLLLGKLHYRWVVNKVGMVVDRRCRVAAEARVRGAVNSFGSAVLEKLRPWRWKRNQCPVYVEEAVPQILLTMGYMDATV